MSVSEAQPGLALVDDGDPLRRPIDHEALQHAVGNVLGALGADVGADGLRETPRRVAQAYAELLTPPGFRATTFPNDDAYEGLIVAEAIPVNSLCMHHLLPFRGLAHVGSLPRERIIGLSKLARVVERFVRDLQIQERLTVQIFEGRLVLVGTEHERRTSVRGCRRTTCAATPGAGASTCTARASYADHDIELRPGRTAVDMKTTLQEIALDVMPQQDDGIPVAEHSLERSAS
jgi:GTP cyclohydrolase I